MDRDLAISGMKLSPRSGRPKPPSPIEPTSEEPKSPPRGSRYSDSDHADMASTITERTRIPILRKNSHGGSCGFPRPRSDIFDGK